MLLNLRCILLCFEAVSGLKINLYKSELVGIGEGGMRNSLARVMSCKDVQVPINLSSSWS